MNDEDLREYAMWVIEMHATDVEYLSVFEMFDEFSPDGGDLSDEDGRRVHDLIRGATVTVNLPAAA